LKTQTQLYSISSTASIALVTVTGQPKVVNDTGTIVGGVVGGCSWNCLDFSWNFLARYSSAV